MRAAAEPESRTQTDPPDVHGWRYSSIVYDVVAVPISRLTVAGTISVPLPTSRSPRVTNPANHTEPVCFTRL